jgi:hypothetical protein
MRPRRKTVGDGFPGAHPSKKTMEGQGLFGGVIPSKGRSGQDLSWFVKREPIEKPSNVRGKLN